MNAEGPSATRVETLSDKIGFVRCPSRLGKATVETTGALTRGLNRDKWTTSIAFTEVAHVDDQARAQRIFVWSRPAVRSGRTRTAAAQSADQSPGLKASR